MKMLALSSTDFNHDINEVSSIYQHWMIFRKKIIVVKFIRLRIKKSTNFRHEFFILRSLMSGLLLPVTEGGWSICGCLS